MKKFSWIIVVAFVLSFTQTSCNYNALVSNEEEVKAAWGQVENVYQRRADLIPQLVNTVKGAANFEKSTLEAVTQARAAASSIKIDPSNMTADDLAKFQNAQDQVGSTLSRLLVTIEAYPELKANQNFLDLQAQLEGTENRIAVERKKFNEATQKYNVDRRKFPRIIFAKIYGFKDRPYFEAAAGSEQAPTVEFDF